MKLIVATLVLAIIYIIQKRLYHKYWKKNLRIKLYFDKNYIECDEKANLIETISNNKFLPLPVMHVKFAIDRSFIFSDMDNSVVTDFYHRNDAFSIMANQRVIRKLEFKGTERGLYSIESANILVRDFFMTSVFAQTIKSDAEIYVFPRKINTRELFTVYRGILGEIISKNSMLTDDMTLKHIRDYQPFDNYRQINWKNSAKAGKLKVNVYDNTRDCSVCILVNLDTDSMIKTDKLLEESISLASTLARSFLKDKISVAVITNGTDVINKQASKVTEGQDMAHSLTIDKYLSRIYGSLGAEFFEQLLNKEIERADRLVTYIVISPYHKPDIIDKLDFMIKNGLSVKMIVPYYDKLCYEPERNYIKSWEVHLDET